jgi:hypothetical protein
MKVTFTFEYGDLLDQIEKMLSMSGVRPLVDDKGNKLITFNHKKKEVVVHCEAIPVPDACPFCGSGVNQEAPKEEPNVKEEPSFKEEQDVQDATANDGEQDSQANDSDEDPENVPLSMAALKAQSSALASRGPTRVQRGAEAHAALATPSLLDGESTDPPFPGEGGM